MGKKWIALALRSEACSGILAQKHRKAKLAMGDGRAEQPHGQKNKRERETPHMTIQ